MLRFWRRGWTWFGFIKIRWDLYFLLFWFQNASNITFRILIIVLDCWISQYGSPVLGAMWHWLNERLHSSKEINDNINYKINSLFIYIANKVSNFSINKHIRKSNYLINLTSKAVVLKKLSYYISLFFKF